MNKAEHMDLIVAGISYISPWFIVIMAFIGAMSFLVAPQLISIRSHGEFLSKLEVGNRVVTNGGLVGILTRVDREILHISFSSMEPIMILRSAIERAFP